MDIKPNNKINFSTSSIYSLPSNKSINSFVDKSYDKSNNQNSEKEVTEDNISSKLLSEKVFVEKLNEYPNNPIDRTKATWLHHVVSQFGASVEGFLDVGEGVVDGHIYGTATLLVIVPKAGRKLLNALNIKEPEVITEYIEYVDNLSYKIIGYDVSKKAEDFITQGLSEEQKEQTRDTFLYNIAEKSGNSAGYKILSKIPFVGVAVAAIGGAGKEVEESINTQMENTGTVNDWSVFYKSLKGSFEGFAEAFVMKKAETTSWKEVISKFDKNKLNITKAAGAHWSGFKSTAIKCLKDPKIWAKTSSRTADRFSSYAEGNFDIKNIVEDWIIAPFKDGRFWQEFGKTTLSEMFK